MDGNEFSAIRHQLGKSQIETAHLLGVSSKAVQSFEQGWRKVPAYCERQLLLLFYLKRERGNEDMPCWELRKCSSETRKKCIVWEFRAGYLCWFVSGTFCEGKAQQNWDKKMQLCRQCEVFNSKFAHVQRFAE
jgi:hypothetical protein